MSRCNLNLEDIRKIFKSIIPKWNNILVRSKWLELKSKYTDDEIVTILNENKEKDVMIAIIKILYKEIKNAHECEKELNKLIDRLMNEKNELERQLNLKKDAKKQLRFDEITKLIKKIKKVTNILPSQLKSLKSMKLPFDFNLNTKNDDRNNIETSREARDARDARDAREGREGREGRDGREAREGIEGREGSEGIDNESARDISSNSNTEQSQVSSNETNNSVAPIIQPTAETLGQMSQMSQMGRDSTGQLINQNQLGTTYVDANYCAKPENKMKPVCKRFNELCNADTYNPICSKCLNNPHTADKLKCIKRAANPDTNCYPITNENIYHPYCTTCLENEGLEECKKEEERLDDLRERNQGSGATPGPPGPQHLTSPGDTAIIHIPPDELKKIKKNGILPYYLYKITNIPIINNTITNTITGYEIEAA